MDATSLIDSILEERTSSPKLLPPPQLSYTNAHSQSIIDTIAPITSLPYALSPQTPFDLPATISNQPSTHPLITSLPPTFSSPPPILPLFNMLHLPSLLLQPFQPDPYALATSAYVTTITPSVAGSRFEINNNIHTQSPITQSSQSNEPNQPTPKQDPPIPVFSLTSEIEEQPDGFLLDTKQNRYLCRHCPGTFARKYDLVRHMEGHCHVQCRTWFCCKNCGRGFARKDALLRHMRAEMKLKQRLERGLPIREMSASRRGRV